MSLINSTSIFLCLRRTRPRGSRRKWIRCWVLGIGRCRWGRNILGSPRGPGRAGSRSGRGGGCRVFGRISTFLSGLRSGGLRVGTVWGLLPCLSGIRANELLLLCHLLNLNLFWCRWALCRSSWFWGSLWCRWGKIDWFQVQRHLVR